MPDDPDKTLEWAARGFFLCSVCGETAGTVELFGSPEQALIVRDSFTSRLTATVPGGSFASVKAALEKADAAALYQYDLEVASFYCPQCNTSFCGKHWDRRDIFDDDGSHDSIRGKCPSGHDRMLED